MLAAITALTLLGLTLGFLLGFAARFFKVESNPIVEQIEALLPGSQCGQCGYPGCAPAAVALANQEVPVTVCPPGGRALAEELANILGVAVDLSDMEDVSPKFAEVQEEICIGCARCLKVCPTDAIIGAPKQIHTVIKDACTSCAACTKVCPTESLLMQEVKPNLKTWKWDKPELELAKAA